METIYVVTYDIYHENDGWFTDTETKWQKFYKNYDCAVEYATKMANHLHDSHYSLIDNVDGNVELKEYTPGWGWGWQYNYIDDSIYITEETVYICDDIKDVDISEDIIEEDIEDECHQEINLEHLESNKNQIKN